MSKKEFLLLKEEEYKHAWCKMYGLSNEERTQATCNNVCKYERGKARNLFARMLGNKEDRKQKAQKQARKDV